MWPQTLVLQGQSAHLSICGRCVWTLHVGGCRLSRAGETMSPTLFREGPYRFFFFSREEPRMHVHVASSEGEAKFWIEPAIALADSHGISNRQLTTLQKIVESHEHDIRTAWNNHFGN